MPKFPGRLPYLAAGTIDAFGNGFYMSFSLLFLHHVTGLSLTEASLAITIAMVSTLAVGPFVGIAIDRYGAKRLLILGNLLSAAGFTGYLLASGIPGVLVAALLAALGNRLFWPSSSALVGELTSGAGRDRLVALRTTLNLAAIGVGGLVAGTAVTFGGYEIIAIAQIVSYLAAATLMSRVPVHRKPRVAAVMVGGGYREIFRDKTFMLFLAITIPVSFAQDALMWALPVYGAEHLGVALAVVGALFTLNTVLGALSQLPLAKMQRDWRRTRSLALGALVYALSFGTFALAANMSTSTLVVISLAGGTIVYSLAGRIQATPLETLKLAIAPAHLRGRYVVAYGVLCAGLTAAFAPLLFTAVLTASPILLWTLLGVGVVASAAGYVRLERRLSPQEMSSGRTEAQIGIPQRSVIGISASSTASA